MNRETNRHADAITLVDLKPRRPRLWMYSATALAILCGGSFDTAIAKDKPQQGKAKAASKNAKGDETQGAKWQSLFDGKSLKGWKVTKFGGEGEVKVEKGSLILGVGADMTGVHTDRKLPLINYEIELEAMRVDGSDFFCGMTFPVGKSPCSLIVGGWGGGLCGLSSIDGKDASQNKTTTYGSFTKGKWYKIRLRVSDTDIQAWIDGKRIVNQKTAGKKLSIRKEVELSRPLGFATWQTTGALRKIRIRPIEKGAAKAASKNTPKSK